MINILQTIPEATQLPISIREPTAEAIEAAEARNAHQTQTRPPNSQTPSPKRSRETDDPTSSSWRMVR